MESYDFLLVIAIILYSTKILGLVSQKVNMPQVVGALVAGILVGPSCLNMVQGGDFLMKISELGVILLMFLAGIDTDLEELKKTGAASMIIAVIGVVVPLVLGFAVYYMFFGGTDDPLMFLKAVFVGVILTATSVSITVETLREMGCLKGKIGTSILGAAIIDDILGIIILTVVTGFAGESVNTFAVFARIFAFFVFLAVVGMGVHFIFKKMDNNWGQKRRIAIFGFGFCLLLSYIAERYFGIADITGAYFAGLILCNIADTRENLAKKLNITSYMIFAPMFFASIGIKTEITGMTPQIILFSIVLLIVAILSKVIGCGLGAKMCRFTNHEALSVGVGMISRGEVALIVAQKGEAANIIDPHLFPAIVMVVIVTTLITPVLLKVVMAPDVRRNKEMLAQIEGAAVN